MSLFQEGEVKVCAALFVSAARVPLFTSFHAACSPFFTSLRPTFAPLDASLRTACAPLLTPLRPGLHLGLPGLSI
jgi:hypothetical protein